MNSRTGRKLPSLAVAKAKTTLDKDRSRIEDLFLETNKNRQTHKDYRHQEDFAQVRAANFLSRINTIDSPEVIFAVADQVSIFPRLDKENEPRPQNVSPTQATQLSEERQEAVNLAKWMEEKIERFRSKKEISFLDIVEYKQTILNYALGRIIDSLTKKCKEEGQLLSLIWNNTFSMFEGVFNILAEANTERQDQQLRDEKELHQMHTVNRSFLIEEKVALQQENQHIF